MAFPLKRKCTKRQTGLTNVNAVTYSKLRGIQAQANKILPALDNRYQFRVPVN
jgi:hypothetical protein